MPFQCNRAEKAYERKKYNRTEKAENRKIENKKSRNQEKTEQERVQNKKRDAESRAIEKKRISPPYGGLIKLVRIQAAAQKKFRTAFSSQNRMDAEITKYRCTDFQAVRQ